MELKETVDFKKTIIHGNNMSPDYNGEEIITIAFDLLTKHCHAASHNRGWWHDPVTGNSLIPDGEGAYGYEQLEEGEAQIIEAWFPYVVATKISLIHSEVAEMTEAHRTGKYDDKIENFLGITAEASDVMIRIFDLFGMFQNIPDPEGVITVEYNLAMALLTKIPFNGVRPDHDFSKRALPGQKRY